MRVFVAVMVGLAAFTGTPCLAGGLAGENFLAPLPKGFSIGSNKGTPSLSMQEMVPEGESINNWTEMVTTQVFRGKRSAPVEPYLAFMYNRFSHACPVVGQGRLGVTTVNGYPAAVQKMSCSRDPLTGKPETTIFEVISGADGFYIAQYAFASIATPADLQKALAYMTSLTVCDTRTTQHPCPDLAAKGFHPL